MVSWMELNYFIASNVLHRENINKTTLKHADF